jgi:hypothetical protein
MSLGLAPRQAEVFATTATFCDGRVARDSIYGLLHRECHRLFPDELFADLFCDGRGRRSVPPMIVAVVMVLQRIEGCSDREAVDRFTYDARWKYAAGGLEFDYPGFVHTVLVDMRARLAASERPERIFEVVLECAKQAGLVGRRRVLDSTAVYDAVATMDTVTLIRSAIRGLLRAADAPLEAELRGLLKRDDDYRAAGKPVCDYEDPAAREALVDGLAEDARALLRALDGRELDERVKAAAVVLAAVVGQDLDEGADGVFRIARRVAKDRVISTVDPQARHGHKTAARGFDGYKGHVSVDPDSELIVATAVTAGNVGDAAAAAALLTGDLEAAVPEPEPEHAEPEPRASGAEPEPVCEPEPERPAAAAGAAVGRPRRRSRSRAGRDTGAARRRAEAAARRRAARRQAAARRRAAAEQAAAASEPVAPPTADQAAAAAAPAPGQPPLAVYGDAADGAGALLGDLGGAAAEIMCKVQPPTAAGGRFTKDAFQIDLQAGTVTCPAGQTAPLRRNGKQRIAVFGAACHGCPLAAQCTTAKGGRTIAVGRHEQQLAAARARQAAPDWQADYKATRPKVERKIGHLMRRKHGGRRARVRGQTKVDADFSLLAAAVNLARLAVLGLSHQDAGWAAATG